MTTMLATKDLVLFEHDSALSIDEKIKRIVLEKERRRDEAWTMMPRLFDIWGKLYGFEYITFGQHSHPFSPDADSSGTLDKNEVFMGVEQYCEARELSFDSRVICCLWSEVDDNGDQVLDRREFAVFLARYCEWIGIALDDLAFVVFEQLAGVAPMQDASTSDHEGKPGALFHRFWALKKSKPRTVYSWAQLKIESEKLSIDAAPSPTWELRRINHAMKLFGNARIGDNSNEDISIRVIREHGLLSKNKLPPLQVKKRRNSNIRPINRIEAKSLDGFFSGVGQAVKRGESGRSIFSSSTTDSA